MCIRDSPGAVLLDVRTPEEYRQGHIPGSKNVPLYAVSYTHLDVYKRQNHHRNEKIGQAGEHGGDNGVVAIGGHVHLCLLYTSRCV